ncbi:MAG: hypothetical protein KC931_23365 [Candidatus Omnitrophica bacterium]|nr:hypothetical protein [Candidatus Omnitrophota bacterium]
MTKEPESSQDVVPIRPNRNQLHRVRITADPGNPKTVEIVEELLTKCDLSRCECTDRDGSSTWTVIVPEESLDIALEGIAVTVPIEGELFESGEGHMYWATGEEWFRLGGIAEDEARCWEEDNQEDFESAVTEEINSMIDSEIDRLPWPSVDFRTSHSEQVREEAFEELDVFTYSEDDIQEAVQSAFDHLVDESNTKEE